MPEDRIPLRSQDEERIVFGSLDRHAKLIREKYQVNLVCRSGILKLLGESEPVQQVKAVIEKVLSKARKGEIIDERQYDRWLEENAKGLDETHADVQFEQNDYSGLRKIKPRTAGQERYVQALREHALVFAIGPAGTGKTYLAVAMAVEALSKGQFRRLVLARPAVEAGEKLGYLPGDFQAKVNPYLRPLYDALNDLLTPGKARQYMESDIIEIVPLAYMRGRTLNHSFIIIDEGQNTTPTQMQMCLTRLGEDSKLVVTGDITQTDLPKSSTSGLIDAWKRLQRIPGIGFVELQKSDIVRHPLVQRIVEAYEKR